ncbi:hypothetical protein F5B19DRAFT_437015 [Rostrohypoxylon terebratum]|nr:hypothetical protein F5B19DRAFT_437015 [Rostrohypoxylon terebratum]
MQPGHREDLTGHLPFICIVTRLLCAYLGGIHIAPFQTTYIAPRGIPFAYEDRSERAKGMGTGSLLTPICARCAERPSKRVERVDKATLRIPKIWVDLVILTQSRPVSQRTLSATTVCGSNIFSATPTIVCRLQIQGGAETEIQKRVEVHRSKGENLAICIFLQRRSDGNATNATQSFRQSTDVRYDL